jgi:hypothetical protein
MLRQNVSIQNSLQYLTGLFQVWGCERLRIDLPARLATEESRPADAREGGAAQGVLV